MQRATPTRAGRLRLLSALSFVVGIGVPAARLPTSEEYPFPLEPTAADCWPGAAAPHATGAGAKAGVRAVIPPRSLPQDISELRLGRAFPAGGDYRLGIRPEQTAAIEQEFCRRDAEMVCLPSQRRTRLVADILPRIARIESRAVLGSPERRAAHTVATELRAGSLPLLLFNTGLHYGPTAGVIRYRDVHANKWVLALAFASDFAESRDDVLLLEGVLVQELTHFDDLSFLPAPLRCYESNLEIRGHNAMIRYWERHRGKLVVPRIESALRAKLGPARTRGAWYRYLNQIEKTDFRIEDELVSLESRTLTGLADHVADDQRFLAELSNLVSDALTKAHDTRNNIATLASDSINANARIIAAVTSLLPRMLASYDRVRGDLRGPDGVSRRNAMATEVGNIQRSLAVLDMLKGSLAANPDFRRKSDFVGPD